jgi:hypothetical protein
MFLPEFSGREAIFRAAHTAAPAEIQEQDGPASPQEFPGPYARAKGPCGKRQGCGGQGRDGTVGENRKQQHGQELY